MSSTGKVNAALAAAVIFLLLSSCSAYFAFNRMNASQGWVRHTRDVQNALAQFSMATARAGRLRSEYIDSGDASLLQQQAELVSQIRTAVATIQRLTADNAHQQANSRKLDDLKEQRIDLLGQAIELKKTGKSTAAAQAAISRQSLATAESTDLLLQRMYDTEEQLLAARQARASRFTSLTAGNPDGQPVPRTGVVYRAPSTAGGSGGRTVASRTGSACPERQGINATG